MNDPYHVYECLRDTYIKYYETRFSLRDSHLVAERHRLLLAEGNILRQPYLEALPPYKSSNKKLGEAALSLGLSDDFAELSSNGLFSPNSTTSSSVAGFAVICCRTAFCGHGRDWLWEDRMFSSANYCLSDRRVAILGSTEFAFSRLALVGERRCTRSSAQLGGSSSRSKSHDPISNECVGRGSNPTTSSCPG